MRIDSAGIDAAILAAINVPNLKRGRDGFELGRVLDGTGRPTLVRLDPTGNATRTKGQDLELVTVSNTKVSLDASLAPAGVTVADVEAKLGLTRSAKFVLRGYSTERFTSSLGCWLTSLRRNQPACGGTPPVQPNPNAAVLAQLDVLQVVSTIYDVESLELKGSEGQEVKAGITYIAVGGATIGVANDCAGKATVRGSGVFLTTTTYRWNAAKDEYEEVVSPTGGSSVPCGAASSASRTAPR